MIKELISGYLIKQGFKRLQRRIADLNSEKLNAGQVIDFLFSKEAELIQPWQFKEEIIQLAQAIEQKKPKVMLEIGTANGGTLFMATRLATDDAKIISLDLPGGKFGGGYPEWKIPIYQSFQKPKQQLHLIRGNSHDVSSLEKVKSILAGDKIDYFFIDGDHTYEGVKHDFELYRSLLAPNAMVVFHDIVVHKNSACNVFMYWNEVKQQFPHKEFVNDWDQNKFGIGLIQYS